jgi:DNA invertase Pin-like site-specific DNA recombinase
VAHEAKFLDRECPRCGAPAAIKCRDLRRRAKTADHEHLARGWLDRPCPTCRMQPGERCVTPTGRPAAGPHQPRWAQQRLQAQRYGYVRVAPGERDVEDVQREALTRAGCVRVWCERPSAVAPARRAPELEQLLEYLRARDVLVVWRLERLAPSAAELADITARLSARAIGLCSIAEHLDSTRPGGEQLFAAIAAIARLDPARPDEQPARRAAARSSVSKGGRPRLLDERAHAAVRAMYDAGEHTIDQIAAEHGVSRPTVYRSLNRTQPSHNGF